MRDALARPVVSVYLEPNRPVYAAVAVMDIVILDIALKDEEGNAVDLTGCSVVVAAQDREKTVLYTGNIVEPLAGAVRAKVQPDVVGRYALSARVCTNNTEDVTFFLGAMSVAAEDPDAGPANSIRSLTSEMLDAQAHVTNGIETLSTLINTTTTATNNANAASESAAAAANAANTAADSANTAADSANTAADSANTAADSANSAANTAAAATQALGDIDALVAGRVQEANTAAANAASSAEHAALSATAAAGSDQHATQSAFAALQSALGADQSAAAALASQNAAQTAQSNAAASASAAAGSAQNAAQSAQAAATSATNAANVVTAGADITITDGPNGTRIASVTPDTFLRLSGGTLTGNIVYNGNSDFSIVRYTNTGRTIVRGGTTYNDGASIYLNGKNYSGDVGAPGAIKFMASNGVQSGSLDLSPDGTLTLNGALSATYLSCNKTSVNKNFDFSMPKANGGGYYLDGSGDLNESWYRILTKRDQPYTAAPLPKTSAGVGQFFSTVSTGSSFTLPSGGTWQYIALLQFDNGVFSTGGRGGIDAGGSTITLDSQGHSVCRVLCFFWRLG